MCSRCICKKKMNVQSLEVRLKVKLKADHGNSVLVCDGLYAVNKSNFKRDILVAQTVRKY